MELLSKHIGKAHGNPPTDHGLLIITMSQRTRQQILQTRSGSRPCSLQGRQLRWFRCQMRQMPAWAEQEASAAGSAEAAAQEAATGPVAAWAAAAMAASGPAAGWEPEAAAMARLGSASSTRLPAQRQPHVMSCARCACSQRQRTFSRSRSGRRAFSSWRTSEQLAPSVRK